MTVTQSRQTGMVRVHLSETEAERLATVLYQVASHTPRPEDDVRASLERALRDTVSVV